MTIEGGRFWFKSSLFEVESGEDDEINPNVYGRQLANWLAAKLRGLGYDAQVINEDWGRCIMCMRDPVWLWIGCANINVDFPEPAKLRKKEDIVWHCFVECEIPFWKRLFKRVDPQPFVRKMTEQVNSLLTVEPEIHFVDEP